MGPRILIIGGALTGGGAERSALNLVKWLRGAGWDVHHGLGERGGEYEGEVPAGLPLHYGEAGRGRNLPWNRGRLGVALRFGRMIAEVEPDLVVTNLQDVNVNFLPTDLVHPRRPFRWIATERNSSATRIPALYGGSPRGRLLLAATGWSLRRADRVVCISNGLATEVVEAFRVDPERLRVIYNPIDIDRVRSAAADVTGVEDPPIILGVGRLSPQKGFDLLIEAAARLDASLGARLVLLGEGPERERLASLAYELGISDRVLMPGFVANPWAWMRRSTVFVLSSRWEGFGNVLVEAMALGVPVVAFDCPHGPAEILEGGSGVLVPLGDVPALSTELEALLRSPQQRARLSERGRTRAGRFTTQAAGEAFASLFEEIIR